MAVAPVCITVGGSRRKSSTRPRARGITGQISITPHVLSADARIWLPKTEMIEWVLPPLQLRKSYDLVKRSLVYVALGSKGSNSGPPPSSVPSRNAHEPIVSRDRELLS
jgi:hypothetical protein